MIYIANVLLPFLYYLILKLISLKKDDKKKIFLFLCSIQIILIVGTRSYSTGIDTPVYYYRFLQMKNVSHFFEIFIFGFEPFYTLLNYIIGVLGLEFMWVNIIVASLTMYFLSKTILESGCNELWSIYLYISTCIFYQMMNQHRQTLAMAIILYAIVLLNKGESKKYIFYTIIAVLFHYSALVSFVVFFLRKVLINYNIFFKYVIATIALFFSLPVIFYLISFTTYVGYIGSIYDNVQATSFYNLLVRVILLLISLYFYKPLKERMNIDLYYHMIIICTIIQLLTIRSALFGRLTTYFFYAYFILLPYIVQNGFKTKKNKIITIVVMGIGFTLYHYVYYTLGGGYEYESLLW